MRSAFRLSLLAATSSLFLISCASVSVQNEATTEQNAEGTMEVEVDGSAELQAGWPEDVPTYPGASVAYSALVTETGNPGAAALLQTGDTPASVIANLTAQLESNGWTVTGSYDAGAMQTIVATKDERVYSAAVQGDGDGTTMTIGVGAE